MESQKIPTADLSPFFKEGDEDGKREEAIEIIGEACSEYGFFQIVNHGVPLGLMRKALEHSITFFDYTDHEKYKCSPVTGTPIPTGYSRLPDHSVDKNEFLLMFPPESSFSVFPINPPEFKQVLEEMFTYFVKISQIIESIINECLGLPPNFLKEYNHDRSWDAMAALRYFPATENENNGLSEHEDANCVSFVFQDEVGGLEVRKNGEWIPVTPNEGTIVVNIGDVIQVWSNNKLKSATHRVVRAKGRSRYSYAYFYSLPGDKWVEPLSHFTKEIGDPPKYRGFFYKDYQQLRIRDKTHPPTKPEDLIHISHYAIPSYPEKEKLSDVVAFAPPPSTVNMV